MEIEADEVDLVVSLISSSGWYILVVCRWSWNGRMLLEKKSSTFCIHQNVKVKDAAKVFAF